MANWSVLVGTLFVLSVIGGCTGTVPSDSSTPTTMTKTPTAEQTAEPCTAKRVEYNVGVPEKPASLNYSRARLIIERFESRYQRAKLNATYENVTISSSRFRQESVKRIDGGYEVTVTFYKYWSNDRLTAKGGYPTTYRITERQFVREGKTLACWG